MLLFRATLNAGRDFGCTLSFRSGWPRWGLEGCTSQGYLVGYVNIPQYEIPLCFERKFVRCICQWLLTLETLSKSTGPSPSDIDADELILCALI